MRMLQSWVLVGTAVLAAAVPAAFAHPGRTDASGCHTCRTNCANWGLKTGQYHCHNSGRRSAITRTSPPPPADVPPPGSDPLPESPRVPVVQRASLEALTAVDGDTFVARERDKIYIVKLSGVEAPELEQPYGQEARDRLTSRIGGQRVMVAAEGADGREISARVGMPDGTDLAEKMLSEGVVWALSSAPDRWQLLQARARAEKIGLWRAADPEPPWAYRRRSMAGRSQRP